MVTGELQLLQYVAHIVPLEIRNVVVQRPQGFNLRQGIQRHLRQGIQRHLVVPVEQFPRSVVTGELQLLQYVAQEILNVVVHPQGFNLRNVLLSHFLERNVVVQPLQ